MYGELPTKETHMIFAAVLLGLQHIGMIDWLITHVVEVSHQVD
jgi:hypothetical protein